MKYLFTIFLLYSFCFLSAPAIPPTYSDNADDILRVLDREAGAYERYEAVVNRRIDSLKNIRGNSADKLMSIAEANRKFNLDTALVYYRDARLRAIDEGNDSLATVALLRYASLLPVSGYSAEAERLFDTIDLSALSAPLKNEYFRAGNQLFFYSAQSRSDRELANSYARRAGAYTDSLLNYLTPGSLDYIFYRAQSNMLRGDRTLALADISELLAKCDETDPRYAIAASMASYYYMSDGRSDKHRIYILALSALSDIKSGRHEMTALQELAKILYERGDLDRAERYMRLALELTLRSGAKMRAVESADLLPAFLTSAREKAQTYSRIIFVISIALAAATAAIVLLLLRIYLLRRKVKTTRRDAAESTIIHDRHIRNLLTLCGECLNRLEDFNRVASRKIKANQVADLHEKILSGKIVHDEFARFLNSFDASFLDTYPDFIADVNVLMQPDKQYAEPADKTLTPELRIIALIRLGIDDSGKIAKMLDLSVNTVYAYRNKIKNRAINRDKFEQEIKNRPNTPI